MDNVKFNTLLLCGILLVGSIMRFFHPFDIPFTFDELSAIVRLNFNSFSELIEYGVKVDGHPAGVHVFLYFWTGLFGYSEFAVKLPFILMGIGAIYASYRIGKIWFSSSVGLFTAASLATLQYLIMYSQIARPYGSGVFLSLMMVLYWSKMIRQEDKFKTNLILFVLFASLSTYNHHFSLLLASIVGIMGVFLIPKKRQKAYIISGIVILLLYIPHISIFFAQLEIGGVESWLKKPDFSFVVSYFNYAFGYSALGLLLVLGLAFVGNKKRFNNGQIVFGLLFFLPFLIGYIYSIYGSAVLQYSVLIFSFPFMFYALWGHIPELSKIKTTIIIIAILSINATSTIFIRNHYTLFYEAPLEQIVIDYLHSKDTTPNLLAIVDSDRAKTKYYFEKYTLKDPFIWSDEFESAAAFEQYIANLRNVDAIYFGTLSGVHPAWVPIIRTYYPKLEWQNNYTGGTNYLFSKSDRSHSTKVLASFDFNHSLPSESVWQNDFTLGTAKLDSTNEWYPFLKINLDTLLQHDNHFIDISLKAKEINGFDGFYLAVGIDKGDENIHSNNTPFTNSFCSDSSTGWHTVRHSIKFSDIDLSCTNLTLTLFIWNQGHKEAFIDDIKVSFREGNPNLYGRFEAIP